MATDTQLPYATTDVWPPNDTEESVLGTNFHQTTITNIRWGVNEAASLGRAPDQPVPWEALSQTALLGCMRSDGSPYRTYPDVLVYPHPIDPQRGSTTIEVDGPPVLVIEVLSDSTYEVDLDLVHGKGYSYACAGVREYLTIDPTGTFLSEGIRAWRLEDGVYRPWEPETDRRWHCATLPIAIGLEGTLATVYTAEGRRMLHEGEVEVELERLRRLLRERQEGAGDRQARQTME